MRYSPYDHGPPDDVPISYFHRSTRRVARKKHTCDICKQAIEPGQVYFYSVGKDDTDDKIYQQKAHTKCDAIGSYEF